MSDVLDMADMQQRVAATEAILSAAAQQGQERNARLLTFLESIEKSLVQKQMQISHLEEEQSRAVEENQSLRSLLHDLLTQAESTLERGPGLAPEALERTIDRLDSITSGARQDGEKNAGGGDAKQPEAPPVAKGRVSKVLSLLGSSLA